MVAGVAASGVETENGTPCAMCNADMTGSHHAGVCAMCSTVLYEAGSGDRFNVQRFPVAMNQLYQCHHTIGPVTSGPGTNGTLSSDAFPSDAGRSDATGMDDAAMDCDGQITASHQHLHRRSMSGAVYQRRAQFRRAVGVVLYGAPRTACRPWLPFRDDPREPCRPP